jgi:three-Cys-motif partner protein
MRAGSNRELRGETELSMVDETPHYLEAEDDGLPLCKYGQQTAEKLDYLRRYLDMFTRSMHRKWPVMQYIDLFAGSGKCQVSPDGTVVLGSPLLALTTPQPFSAYFFVDLKPSNIASLQERCTASPLHDRVQCFVGDANRAVHTVVAQITAGGRSSLNLAFLDPEGLELHWSTVEALARLSHMDLIIHYSQMGLTREVPKALARDEPTAVDRFFGDEEWRKICAEHGQKRGLQRKLLDHYKGKLSALGYVEVTGQDALDYDPLMRSAPKHAPLYRLIFASKHPLGAKFGREVKRRDMHGQRRLLESPTSY